MVNGILGQDGMAGIAIRRRRKSTERIEHMQYSIGLPTRYRESGRTASLETATFNNGSRSRIPDDLLADKGDFPGAH